MAALTYKDAGVDIDRADDFIRRIKPLLARTSRPEVLGALGGFGGLFLPRLKGMRDPVLVSSTDGVGTKLMVAEQIGRLDTVGIDLVAMCVNDVAVTGAEPLFFLDYIACGKLDNDRLVDLMKGITRGCREAGCALIGGETAEMPGMYDPGKVDLAGFCVGIIARSRIIDGSACRPGDRLIGLASSGLHSNGYSLVRKILSAAEIKSSWARDVLRPTRIYVRSLLEAHGRVRLKALAHITGGGFIDNIPRVLPPGLGVRIRRGSWPVPAIFRKLQKKGGVSELEMHRTFNMGIGMVAVTAARSAARAMDVFESLGEKAFPIGVLTEGKGEVSIID